MADTGNCMVQPEEAAALMEARQSAPACEAVLAGRGPRPVGRGRAERAHRTRRRT